MKEMGFLGGGLGGYIIVFVWDGIIRSCFPFHDLIFMIKLFKFFKGVNNFK